MLWILTWNKIGVQSITKQKLIFWKLRYYWWYLKQIRNGSLPLSFQKRNVKYKVLRNESHRWCANLGGAIHEHGQKCIRLLTDVPFMVLCSAEKQSHFFALLIVNLYCFIYCGHIIFCYSCSVFLSVCLSRLKILIAENIRCLCRHITAKVYSYWLQVESKRQYNAI